MHDHELFYEHLLKFSPSEGIARSALLMFCFISRFGWFDARLFFPHSTFYRNKRLLDDSGLSSHLPKYSKSMKGYLK